MGDVLVLHSRVLHMTSRNDDDRGSQDRTAGGAGRLGRGGRRGRRRRLGSGEPGQHRGGEQEDREGCAAFHHTPPGPRRSKGDAHRPRRAVWKNCATTELSS